MSGGDYLPECFPEMPEPYSHIYPMDEETGTHAVCFTPSHQPGGGLAPHQPIYTAEHMRDFLRRDRLARKN